MSIILCLYGSLGIGIMLFSQDATYGFLEKFSYGFLFAFVPLLAGIGIWCHKTSALVLALLFFMFQIVKLFKVLAWFAYYPPFSLSIPFGDFAKGSAYFIDFFAIFMVCALAMLLYLQRRLRVSIK